MVEYFDYWNHGYIPPVPLPPTVAPGGPGHLIPPAHMHPIQQAHLNSNHPAYANYFASASIHSSSTTTQPHQSFPQSPNHQIANLCSHKTVTSSVPQTTFPSISPSPIKTGSLVKVPEEKKKVYVPKKGEYECDNCHKVYNLRKTLNQHKKVHSGIKPFSCDVCGKSFTQRGTLNLHKTIHTGVRPYECDKCNKKFSRKAHLETHMSVHLPPEAIDYKFECEICFKRFQQKQGYERHKRIHTGEKPYSCNDCERKFATTSLLLYHRRRKHTMERPYPCDECEKRFIKSGELKAHKQKIHRKGRIPDCEKPYACHICDKRFNSSEWLTQHIKIHTSERFPCHLCKRIYNFADKLESHIKWSHNLAQSLADGELPPQKKFACNQCEKRFTEQSNLRKHIREHIEGKPHSCEQCNRSFRLLSELTKHKLIHDMKRFPCLQCKRIFNFAEKLENHIKWTHNLEETLARGELPPEKKYSCVKCEKKFSNCSNLRKHMITHDPSLVKSLNENEMKWRYINAPEINGMEGDVSSVRIKEYLCNFCDKTFLERKHCVVHMQIHSGEKSHSCDTCSKAFLRKTHLNRHKMIHLGVKPYSCNICKKSFSRNAHLKKHKLIHTAPSKDKPFSCDGCGASFPALPALTSHMRYKCIAKDKEKKELDFDLVVKQESDTNEFTLIIKQEVDDVDLDVVVKEEPNEESGEECDLEPLNLPEDLYISEGEEAAEDPTSMSYLEVRESQSDCNLSPKQLNKIEDTDSTSDDNTDIEQELDDIKNENDVYTDEMKLEKEDL